MGPTPPSRRRLPRRRTLRRTLVPALLLLWPYGPARAADPQPYTVTLAKTGDAAIDGALKASSSLVTLRTSAPAGPFALVGRARSDADRLETVLGGFGYYDAHVTVTIDGAAIGDPALPDRLAALPKGTDAHVAITVARGPLFHLGHVTVRGDVTPGARAAFDLHPGQPAVAADVLSAGARLLTALEDDGHAFARVDPPLATEIPSERALDVVFTVSEGPRVDIGPISLDGLEHVHRRYIEGRLTIRPGELYQANKIEAARQDLASIGVFSTVTATTAKAPDANDEVPITFTFVEAPPRTVALTAAYSTDLGGSAGVTWTHHNFFGNAEQLELAAIATGLGGTAEQGLGYDVYAQLTKPDFGARNQNLRIRVEALKQNLYTYDQTAELAEIGLARRLSSHWNVGANVLGEQEQIIQEGVTRDYELAQLPLTANFDDTDLANPLDDATHGFRVGLGITPSESFGGVGGNSFFAILQGQVATYVDLHHLGLGKPGRSVLAVRGLVASVQGATTLDLPPDQRLYAGGSNTIRGYKYQQVAPLFPDDHPIGGTSLDAVQVELRQRIYGPIGIALFADGGQVGSTGAPGQGPLRIGVGAGVRYYTGIGPIRVDIALPVETIPGNDSFELYVGLGEAF